MHDFRLAYFIVLKFMSFLVYKKSTYYLRQFFVGNVLFS